jgi:hypothetical protein
MKTARELELERLHDAVNLVVDPQRLLFVCLTGASPKDAQTITYAPLDDVGGKVPGSFKDRAQALYKIAGTELAKSYSQPLCQVIEDFLATVMTEPELADFKIKNPMKYPIKQGGGILDEMGEGDPGVAEWLAQQRRKS